MRIANAWRRKGSILTIAVFAISLVATAGADSVFAQADSMSVGLNETKRNVETPYTYTQKDVPLKLQGRTCTVVITARNNHGSNRPDSDLRLVSGSNELYLRDVEREQGGETREKGELTLGKKVTVDIVNLKDGTFSGGFDARIDCPRPRPQLTCDELEVMPTSDRAPLEATFSVTTGAEHTTINEYAFDFGDGQNTATTKPRATHVYQKAGQYQASVTVTSDDAQPADCKVGVRVDQTEQEEEEPQQPEELPAAGFSPLAGLLASGTLGISLRGWITSRRRLKADLLG